MFKYTIIALLIAIVCAGTGTAGFGEDCSAGSDVCGPSFDACINS